MKTKFSFITALILIFFGCVPEKVTFESLLIEMTDRESLARFPAQEYTCKQFSSYDRETVAQGDSSWFANWDRSMFIRIEEKDGKKEYVMMDTEGPGAIVRFWMTFSGEDCGKGTLRIYFDNDTIPAIQGGAMEILSGGKLAGEPLCSSVSDSTAYEMRGHNMYLPLPYSRHCKVTYESVNIKDPGAKTGGEAVYYNINYRTYNQGTKVATFSMDEMRRAEKTLNDVQTKLKNRDRGLDGLKTESKTISGKISPGNIISETITGKKAIRRIQMKIKAGNMEQALRSTVISIWFDENGSENRERALPNVCSPAGDFFGTGYQIRFSNTWYTRVDNDGTMTAWWVMPFEKNCTVELYNAGEQDVEIESEITDAPWNWDKRSMHFGVTWHQFTNLQTGEMKNNEGAGDPFDINYVTLAGKGKYVGDAITLFNTVYAWWGEGDEKIYVDGEKFPSHIGTGTEDYYGYAWCRPEKFSNHPFIAQPDGSGNFWPGYTVNTRFRSLDAIPYNSSLVVDMEMWHWTKATINFAPVTFYYILKGNNPNIKIDQKGMKEPVALKRADIVSPELVVDGDIYYIEGENLIFDNATGGNFQYQNNVRRGWSNNMQLFWTNGKPGDRLTLKFTSQHRIKGELKALFTYANDFGSFVFSLNGRKSSINLWADKLKVESRSLGMHDIYEGENTITIEITGTANNERKTAFFGLDRLEIK